MAPKKDKGIFASFKDEDQYYEDFEQKLYDGFHAQKTNLDKLSYIMELSAMSSDLAIIRARLMKVPSAVDRDDYKSEEALLKSINVYSQDKEKVRFLDDGVARFDNTMDALSIMKDNIPGIGDVIDARVSAINKTRKAESADHKDHLDLTKYGAERAQAEYAKRTGQPAEEKEQVKDEDGPVLS